VRGLPAHDVRLFADHVIKREDGGAPYELANRRALQLMPWAQDRPRGTSTDGGLFGRRLSRPFYRLPKTRGEFFGLR
jgi:hypothetical protein